MAMTDKRTPSDQPPLPDQPPNLDTGQSMQEALAEDSPSAVRRYGVAVLCVAGGVTLRWLLDPILGADLPFATVYGFVALTVWYGGWAPALFTTVVSFAVANWLFVHPKYMFSFEDIEPWRLGTYLFSTLVLIGIVEAMRHAQRQARLYATAVSERQRQLEAEVLERKHAEQALHRTVKFDEAVMLNMGEGLYTEDDQGMLTSMNPAAERLLGWSLDEVRGRKMHEVIHYKHRDGTPFKEEDCAVLNVLREATVLSDCEDVFIRKDGTFFDVSYSARTLRENNKIIGLVVVFRDITERKHAEEELRNSEERLRSFSGHLEHMVEERTKELVHSQDRLRMMATELNLAEQRERKRLAGDLHDYLAQMLVLCRLNLGQVRRASLPKKVDDQVKDTEEVLNRALQFSRTLMAELSPPVLQEHGLPAGLKWLAEQMQSRGLNVVVDVADADAFVLSENCAVLLYQSVRELLTNVLKHADCQEAAVHLQKENGKLRLDISDNGRGFDLVVVPADPSITAMSSKFGLYSIRERMKALGGWFECTSAPGKGTRATLLLPIDVQAVVSDQRSGGDVSHHSSVIPTEHGERVPIPHEPLPQGIKVLLVDDHAMVRQGLRSVLDQYANIEVVGEAWNGEDAVEAATALKPAIVLMDINMPKMNGIDATAAIKARFPDMIVIGLSVHAGGANEAAMIQAGAAMLLTKEAAVDELYQVIEHVLRDVPPHDRKTSS